MLKYELVTIKTLRQFIGFYVKKISAQSGAKAGWIFRGQQDKKWKLETSLHRVCKRNKITRDALSESEDSLLVDFQRRYKAFSPQLPAPPDHQRAPTRMLDWTYSFFVAAFFALEEAKGDAVVWALDSSRLSQTIAKRYPRVWKRLNDFFESRDTVDFDNAFSGQVPFVYLATPRSLNLRLTIQQGVPLCPGDIGRSFEANLRSTGKIPLKKICAGAGAGSDVQ